MYQLSLQSTLMVLFGTEMLEPLSTNITVVWSFSCMNSHVCFQLTSFSKVPATFSALMWFHSSVSSHMFSQRIYLFTTFRTRILDTLVNGLCMEFEFGLGGKLLATLRALTRKIHSFMY